MQGTGWPVHRFRALSQLGWGEILGTKAKKKKKGSFVISLGTRKYAAKIEHIFL